MTPQPQMCLFREGVRFGYKEDVRFDAALLHGSAADGAVAPVDEDVGEIAGGNTIEVQEFGDAKGPGERGDGGGGRRRRTLAGRAARRGEGDDGGDQAGAQQEGEGVSVWRLRWRLCLSWHGNPRRGVGRTSIGRAARAS